MNAMMSQVTEVTDPSIRGIAQRIAREAELAVEKAAAGFGHPEQFPLSTSPRSLERILHDQFQAFPEAVKAAAAARALERINASPETREARLGDLARVDLNATAAVEDQVQSLPFPAGLRLPQDHPVVAHQLEQRRMPRPLAVLSQQPATRLQLFIHTVTCVDETDGFAGSEAGSDEIDLGGTVTDAMGNTRKIEPFRVRGDFDDGEEQVYAPARLFAEFDLAAGTEFPKSYFVTLVLAEADMGGLPEFLDKLLNWVKEKVITALTTAAGTIVGSTGGPVGALIGAAIGAAVGWVCSYIKEIWEDDIFAPATLSVTMPSLDARWDGRTESSQGVITFTGHGGQYQLVYSWNIVLGQAPPISRPGVIYALQENGDLLWYCHDGRDDGSFRWAEGSGQKVGNGWDFKHVFSGGEGVIYAIRENGDLLWYRHDGPDDGRIRWGEGSGQKVGNGWNFKHVFSAGEGLIYAVEENALDPVTGQITSGRLVWYRHLGWRDGGLAWAEHRKVGTGWSGFKQVFSGGEGVIYAVKENGDLLWYRHDGRADGSFKWADGSGNKVGNGWHFKDVFSGGSGIIYGVEEATVDPRDGRRTGRHLLWYRHNGWRDGSASWAPPQQVGKGWRFKLVFNG